MDSKQNHKNHKSMFGFLRNPFGSLKRTDHTDEIEGEPKDVIPSEKKPETRLKFPIYEGVKKLVSTSRAHKGEDEDEEEDDSDDGLDEFRQRQEVDLEKEQKRYFRRIRAFMKRSGRDKVSTKGRQENRESSQHQLHQSSGTS